MAKQRLKYLCLGIGFGLVFPVLALILLLALYVNGEDAGVFIEKVNFVSIWELHKSRPLFWVIDSAPLVLGSAGFWIGTQRDRIYRINKRQGQAVSQYRTLFKQATEGVMLVDPKSLKILDVNPKLCTIFEYTEESLIGTHVEFYVSEDKKIDFTDLSETLREKGVFTVETECIRRGGTRFWAEIVIATVPVLNKTVLQVSMKDISSIRDLVESEARISRIFQNMTDLICTCDENWYYTDVSPSVQRLTGYEPKELLGKKAFDFIHPDDLEDLNPETIIELGVLGRVQIQYRFKHKTGRYVWVETVSEPIIDQSSKTLSLITDTRNITKQKQAEINRNEILLELENRVKSRTVELSITNEKLTLLYKDLTDSIEYASHIQKAFISTYTSSDIHVNKSLIINLPKDVIGGDFHWHYHNKEHNCTYLALGDCTGHGVPGSMMTVLGVQVLDHLVMGQETRLEPSSILSKSNHAIKEFLDQREGSTTKALHDGMEIGLIRIDHADKKIVYASAGRPLYFYSEGELRPNMEYDKLMIGGLNFSNKEVQQWVVDYKIKDRVYMFSDGYADQFGGSRSKKMLKKRAEEYLASIQDQPFNSHQKLLKDHFRAWQGDNMQVDDVMCIGIEL